nr:hypothetical protein [uncultured Desulfobacter sp.]
MNKYIYRITSVKEINRFSKQLKRSRRFNEKGTLIFSAIYIDASNELCLSRIEKRRKEQPERSATDTPEMFEQVTKYFVAPSKDEGFNIERVL